MLYIASGARMIVCCWIAAVVFSSAVQPLPDLSTGRGDGWPQFSTARRSLSRRDPQSQTPPSNVADQPEILFRPFNEVASAPEIIDTPPQSLAPGTAGNKQQGTDAPDRLSLAQSPSSGNGKKEPDGKGDRGSSSTDQTRPGKGRHQAALASITPTGLGDGDPPNGSQLTSDDPMAQQQFLSQNPAGSSRFPAGLRGQCVPGRYVGASARGSPGRSSAVAGQRGSPPRTESTRARVTRRQTGGIVRGRTCPAYLNSPPNRFTWRDVQTTPWFREWRSRNSGDFGSRQGGMVSLFRQEFLRDPTSSCKLTSVEDCDFDPCTQATLDGISVCDRQPAYHILLAFRNLKSYFYGYLQTMNEAMLSAALTVDQAALTFFDDPQFQDYSQFKTVASVVNFFIGCLGPSAPIIKSVFSSIQIPDALFFLPPHLFANLQVLTLSAVNTLYVRGLPPLECYILGYTFVMSTVTNRDIGLMIPLEWRLSCRYISKIFFDGYRAFSTTVTSSLFRADNLERPNFCNGLARAPLPILQDSTRRPCVG